jgi:molecular chaperone HtpG
MTTETQKERLDFQAEVRQLLDLMIRSLYSNKEIFLRELISNASDAADKLRFEALSDETLYEGDPDLKIRVRFDKDARTITVSDNGIGMSREEIIENLGTIAKSGTRQFFEALTGDQAKDAQLIGQFGVGFYSCFIVAERVTVTSRRAGLPRNEGARWESSGEGEFTVETVDKPRRGTDVVLHLREGEEDLLDGFALRSIIHKYSDHILLPIVMPKEGEGAEDETVNTATALWTRSKNEISEDEYHEFYKHVAHDFDNPLAYTHNQVEGKLEYTSLLFVPAHAPFDLWDPQRHRGVKLYVRRVFITDDAEHLMPSYLRFIRGVIDSNDLPLNISREVLQQNKQIEAIRAGSVKKVLGLLEHLAANDAERYATFWKEFGRVLKEGIVTDSKNHERIAKLCRFASSHGEGEEQTVSLDDYVGRMKEGQTYIYYLTAESFPAARNSPHLEIFRDKGIEVLLLTDPVDEWVVSHLESYQDKPLKSVARGELDLGKLDDEAAREHAKQAGDEHKDLLERINGALGERVKEVRATHRLTASPACLVADEHEMSAHLERILKATGQKVPGTKPILEVNPHHPLVQRLATQDQAERFDDWAHILFDQALLSEGGALEDPAGFVRRLNALFLDLAEVVPAQGSQPETGARAERKDRGTRRRARKTE